MRILVTGGAGFIGSHVCDRLLALGHETAVLDNFVTGFRANVNPGARFYETDIRDRSGVDKAFGEFKPEIVVHHAAQMDVRKSMRDPFFDADVNILGSLNILACAVKTGVRKIIYASTGGAVYGEARCLPVREDHPVNPICHYGVSKHAAEHYLFLYSRHYPLKYTVLRYPNVYGPRQNPDGEAGVVAIFLGNLLRNRPCAIFGDGEQTRDYVYVADIVDANILALERGDGEILNIGSGIGVSVNAIYANLKEILATGSKPVYMPKRPGEIEHIALDPSRAAEVLGWSCRISLREGLEKTAAYFRSLYGRSK